MADNVEDVAALTLQLEELISPESKDHTDTKRLLHRLKAAFQVARDFKVGSGDQAHHEQDSESLHRLPRKSPT